MKIGIQHMTRTGFLQQQKLVINQFLGNPVLGQPSGSAPVVAESRHRVRKHRAVVVAAGLGHAVSPQPQQQEL